MTLWGGNNLRVLECAIDGAAPQIRRGGVPSKAAGIQPVDNNPISVGGFPTPQEEEAMIPAS